MLVYSRLYDEAAMGDMGLMVRARPDDEDLGGTFDALTTDADEATRHRLVESFAATMAAHLAEHDWLSAPEGRTLQSAEMTREVFVETIQELYNEAQLDVLGRASVRAQELLEGHFQNAGTDPNQVNSVIPRAAGS